MLYIWKFYMKANFDFILYFYFKTHEELLGSFFMVWINKIPFLAWAKSVVGESMNAQLKLDFKDPNWIFMYLGNY